MKNYMCNIKILLFFALLFCAGCNKNKKQVFKLDKCQAEIPLLSYKQGSYIVFKDSITNAIDTLVSKEGFTISTFINENSFSGLQPYTYEEFSVIFTGKMLRLDYSIDAWEQTKSQKVNIVFRNDNDTVLFYSCVKYISPPPFFNTHDGGFHNVSMLSYLPDSSSNKGSSNGVTVNSKTYNNVSDWATYFRLIYPQGLEEPAVTETYFTPDSGLIKLVGIRNGIRNVWELESAHLIK